MSKKVVFLFLLFLVNSISYSQPKLKIFPDQIRFRDLFHRMENVYFINDGDSTLVIDSIFYRKNIYYLRFNRAWQYPFILAPRDTIKMDCILSRYNLITYKDTSDTMFVYHKGYEEVEKVKIKIDFYKDKLNEGLIKGKVSNKRTALNNAKIYFFYKGRYLVDSSATDQSGYYSKYLPEGSYTAAANKKGYRFTFFDQKYDPFNSSLIQLAGDSTKEINFNLIPDSTTGYSISGKIFDSTPFIPLKRAIIVIRKGIHNPIDKITIDTSKIEQDGIYTTLVNSFEEYNVNISKPGYYFVQAFSDFYLPGYYTSSDIPTLFWQNSDSVLINNQLLNKDIYMKRDSSFGGGTISGMITYSGNVNRKVSDITILAKSVDYGSYINYTVPKDSGNFILSELPFGKYLIIAQKIGFEDIHSENIIIDSLNTDREGLLLQFQTSVHDDNLETKKIQLYQNYPNPFNPNTTILFYLPEDNFVSIEVSNILGEQVSLLYQGYLHEGDHKFLFNGNGLSSGIYFVSLQTSDVKLVKKILLMK
jgi:hypothetical protein